MRDQSINTFNKGLAKDIGPTVPQEGVYADAKNIRIVSDGDGHTSAIVTSVNGNQKKVQLFYNQTYTYYSPDGQSYEDLFYDDDNKPVTVIGYTYFNSAATPNLVIFGIATKEYEVDESALIKTDTSLIYVVNLETFSVNLLYENEDFKFNRNLPIEAVARYENFNIQRVYWTDNKNPVRVINIAAD
mgnify:CR=1 FL=1